LHKENGNAHALFSQARKSTLENTGTLRDAYHVLKIIVTLI
jgi:hypothetical protein